MINDISFSPELKKLRLGLLRLSPALKITDKNPAIEKALRLPRRGADFSKICTDAASYEKLTKLSSTPASLCVITVNSAGKAPRLLSLREKYGSILLILHPLLSTLDTAVSTEKIEKALLPHAQQILQILDYPAILSDIYPSNKNENETFRSAFGYSASPEVLNIKNICPLESAVRNITDLLSGLDLKKELSFIIDPSVTAYGQFIDLSRLVYVIAEMLDTDALIAPSEASIIRINSERSSAGTLSGTLNIILTGRGSKLSRLYSIRLGLFSEILSLLGVHFKRRFDPDGHFMLGASIPLEAQPFRLREPEVAELRAFFDTYLRYALEFYGLLSDNQNEN